MSRFFTPLPLRPLVVLLAWAVVVSAQEKSAPANVLEKFFELGLPDAKGGKWARISTMDGEGDAMIPGQRGRNVPGNGWVLRESKGVVEAVMTDGRVVRSKKMKDDDAEAGAEGELQPVQVEPANLDEDLKAFATGLKSPNASRFSGDENDQVQMRARMAGGTLLFLAQLQRQGRGDFVRDTLPLVLASAPSPEAALDGAVSVLADGQLAALARQWVEKGDAVAYAAGIEKVAATFPRGWRNRDAALLLAAKVRDQKPSPLSSDTDARLAAQFLFKLKPGQFRELPTGRNWFIEGSGRGPSIPGFPGGIPGDEDSDEPAAGAPVKQSGEIAAFFANKHAAAMALAKLLDDHRFLRTTTSQDGDYGRHSVFSSGRRASREQMLHAQYIQLPRPSEVGELVWSLLRQLLPEDVHGTDEESAGGRAASMIAWLKGVAGKNDEELAWAYLQNSERTHQEEFRGSLSFLVEKGGADTLARLRDVFLDPVVWRGGSMEELLGQLEKYIQRTPADASFADKLRATVKSALDDEDAERRKYSGSNDEMSKYYVAQRTAQLKRIEQIFKPPQGVAEQLAEILVMDETEAAATLNAATQSLVKKGLAEIEAPILQAAAKAKSVMLKSQMLQLLLAVAMANSRGQPAPAGTVPAVPADPATREAMLVLLCDDTRVPNEHDPANAPALGDITSWVLVGLHSPQARQVEWQRLGMTVPQLAKKWIHAHALAIANGQPLPPMPDATRIAAGRAAALVAELGALPAAQIPVAFDGKSPDEQVAVAAHLQRAVDWPASLSEAHFSVRKVSGLKAAEIGAAAWKDRRLEEKLAREIQTAVENSALEGKFYAIRISGGEPLGGVEISIEENARTIPAEQSFVAQIPGLSGKPAPIAFGAGNFEGAGNQDDPGNAAMFGFPIWKDAKITRAWRDEHGKPLEKAANDGQDGSRDFTNPALFDRRLRAFLSLQKDARGIFRVTFEATGIRAE